MAEFENINYAYEAAIYINVVFGNWGTFILLNRGFKFELILSLKRFLLLQSNDAFKYIIIIDL